MIKQSLLAGILGCALLGCTPKAEPLPEPSPVKPGPVVQHDPPKTKETPPAKPEFRKVTILVDGMVDKLSLV